MVCSRTARSAKYLTLVESIKIPGLEFVEVNDIATGDFTEALKGVDAVIHVACPLPGRKSTEETFTVSYTSLHTIKHRV